MYHGWSVWIMTHVLPHKWSAEPSKLIKLEFKWNKSQIRVTHQSSENPILAQLRLSIRVASSKIWSMALLLQAMYLHYNWGQNSTLQTHSAFCSTSVQWLMMLLRVSGKITHREKKYRERERECVLLLLFFLLLCGHKTFMHP